MDFNLMMRKGACEGSARAVRLTPGESYIWTEPSPKDYPNRTLAAYCIEGEAKAGGYTARAAAC